MLAIQALRQPLGPDCSRGGFALAACCALTSEHVLRRGTSREMPSGELRVRLHRAHALAERQSMLLRGKAARGLSTAQAAANRIHPNRLLLPAAVLLATGVLLVSGGNASKVEEDLKLRFSSISKEIHAKGLDRVFKPAMQPPLLLVAMIGCDVAMKENGLLGRVAASKRTALQHRAPPVPIPGPLCLSGGQIMHATVALWRFFASVVALVPASMFLHDLLLHIP
jgi:hypothetical protein